MPFPYHQFIGEFIAFATSIICFSKLNNAFKVVAVHSIVAFGVELFGYCWRSYMLLGSNEWLYNLYLLFDCGFILLASNYFLKPKINSRVFFLLFLFFLLFWTTHVYKNKSLEGFAYNAFILDSAYALGLFLYVLYNDAISYKGKLIGMPTLWLCIGIVVNYGCNIPYFSTINYQNEICTTEQKIILHNIMIFINHIRYVFVSIALILVYLQNSKKPIKSPLNG